MTGAQQTGGDAAYDLEVDVENAVAVCGGDATAAVRALLVANNFLAAEVDRLSALISRGYARETPDAETMGRIRKRGPPGF